MKKIKTIFCGTPKISSEVLKTILKMENIEVLAIVTQPDRPFGRKKILKASETKQVALENNIKIFQPEKIASIKEELIELSPDLMLTCAYGQFIPEGILNIFDKKVNIHASLLPKYRGGSPIQYAILNGDKKTGISLMEMIKKMDAGKVYVQEEIEIDDNDNAANVFEKITNLATEMIQKYLYDIVEGKIKGWEQDDEKATFAYNLSGNEEKINWSKTDEEVYNFIRALTPSPIPYTTLNGERWKIGKARKRSGIDNLDNDDIGEHEPGEIIKFDTEGIWVATSTDPIKILEIQREGRKMINAGTIAINGAITLEEKFD